MTERVPVAIMGAGFSGLAVAVGLLRAGRSDFVVLERAADLGGTWRDNTYPGCACDVPSHLYSFSFAPNPSWSRSFSPQPEIWAYLRRVARDFGVLPHVRCGVEVTNACWDDAAGCWHLDTSAGPLDAEVLVWTAGVKPDPVVAATGFPLDDRGRVRTRADLRIEGHDEAWSAGDCAAVPDLTSPGAFCSPSAQHAVRQARQLGDNLAAVLRGEPTTDYRHAYAGSVASLGLYQGVAQVYGVKLKGFPAWFMHRTYHMSRMPTFSRKAQVVLDWTQALLFRREVVGLWSMREPTKQFHEAAGGAAERSA